MRSIRPWVAHTPPFSGKYLQEQPKFPSVSQNGFPRNTKLSDHLIATGNLKPRQPRTSGTRRVSRSGRASVHFHTSAYSSASVGRNGFTLIEIIVALCIVAILSAIAIPGFRKATEDIRMNIYVNEVVNLVKSFRSYYLIFNEFPPNATNGDLIPNVLIPFIPRHYVTNKRKGTEWYFNCHPLGNTKNWYDLDNTMTMTQHNYNTCAVATMLTSSSDINPCLEKLKLIFDERFLVTDTTNWVNWSYGMAKIFCVLPECPGKAENRYC
ncbi:MAG: type II secretion system GspH family protein [Puniceicoccales bacterium]|nr:type II secretion system GspH family protein [Puniceicoccales bacterium]